MFRAIGRWFKALGYLLTGQIDSARRVLDTNPHVVRAKYDAIIRDKVARIQTYKQAVAGLIAQQENKMAVVKRLTDEVQNLERLRAGALAKAKQTVEKLKAAAQEDIQNSKLRHLRAIERRTTMSTMQRLYSLQQALHENTLV